ncbi:MAG: glycosyltransferase, partial [Bacteroidota bacterium]
MQRISSSLVAAGWEVVLVGRLRPNSKALPDFTFATHRLKCRFEQGKWFYLEYNIRLFFWLLRQSTDVYGAIDLDTMLP